MKNVFKIRVKNTLPRLILKRTIRVLLSGGVIIYPTDTLYGLGVNATNNSAVNALFRLKGRKKTKATSIMLAKISEITLYCALSKRQKTILNRHLPGPFTFLCKAKKESDISKKLIHKTKKCLGIRMPDSPIAIQIAKAFKKPITATSANTSGLPSPASAAEVRKYLLKNNPEAEKIPILIINAGKLPGTPSTIIDLTTKKPTVVRQGVGLYKFQNIR